MELLQTSMFVTRPALNRSQDSTVDRVLKPEQEATFGRKNLSVLPTRIHFHKIYIHIYIYR